MQRMSISRSDWLKIAGAAVVLVSSFLVWLDIRLEQGDLVRRGSANAYDFTFTGAIPVAVLVLVGAITVLLALGRIPRHRVPWPLAMVVAAVAATVLLLVRLIANPYDGRTNLEQLGGSIDRGIGMALAVAGSLVVSFGALTGYLAARRADAEGRLDAAHPEWAPEPSTAHAFPPPAPHSPTS